ncbi:MAG: YigZ family protein [Gemmatimonadaceae bacterium]|nr:YigZ family protein [Gemmatimonadaceae bacterium]
MADPQRYPIPAQRVRTEDVVDRSRFICTLAAADSPEAAHALVRDVSAEFPDATHHCWAFVAGAPGSTGRIGMSDDGEPHGTAGRPMLTVLLHSGIGEVAAVVTRYYGGTKLGTGGLARAYSGAVQSALAALTTREKVAYAPVSLTVSYAHFSAVQHLMPAFEAEVTGEVFAEEVTLHLRVPVELATALRAAIGNTTHGQAHFFDEGEPAA